MGLGGEILSSADEILNFVIEHREVPGLAVLPSSVWKHYDETCLPKGFGLLPIRQIKTKTAVQEQYGGIFIGILRLGTIQPSTETQSARRKGDFGNANRRVGWFS